MNVVVIAVTVWLVLAWIGLVFLIAKTGRNRRANLPRPPIDRTQRNHPSHRRSSRRHQGEAPYYWAGVGGGATGDWNQDEKREEWGGGDWGGGDFGGGDWGGGSFGGGDSGGGDSGGGGD